MLKISVITVSYNAETTIADALRSVSVQDWPEVEHIVIDGASSDETVSIIRAQSHPRMRWLSEPDRGAYDAMNKGLALATGDVVGFLNADDLLARTDALRIVASGFAEGIDCVMGQTVVVDQHDLTRVRRVYSSTRFRRWMLRFGHMPPHPAFYARRSALNKVGGFDPTFRISGDFDQIVKLYFHENINTRALRETLAVFREGGLSTADLSAKLTINKEITRSLAQNGVLSHPLLLWLRYPFKSVQWLGRAKDIPMVQTGVEDLR